MLDDLLIKCGFREDYNPENRQVALDYIEIEDNKYVVSTVDLGYNVSFWPSKKLYYESMVFDSDNNPLHCERYESKEDALLGHKYILDSFNEVIK